MPMIDGAVKYTIVLQGEDKALLPLVEEFAAFLKTNTKRIVKTAKKITTMDGDGNSDE